MRRFSVIVVLALVLVTALVGAAAAQHVTINFLNFSSSGDNEVHLEAMKEIFEAQNPNIKVNIETIGYNDYFVRLMTTVVGGNTPDAFELNFENFSAYASKGTVLPLGELMAQTGFDPSVSDA